MSLTAPARAARFALLQRFLVVLGLVAVAALLLFAATSKARAFNLQGLLTCEPIIRAWCPPVADPGATPGYAL